MLIGKAFGDVLFSRMSDKNLGTKSLKELVTRPTLILACIGSVPLIIILIFGDVFFAQ
jgi:hypothetical protein